jgi:two-component system, response regulator RegA
MNPNPTLLVAEDDDRFGETLELEFADRGYRVTRIRSLAAFAAIRDPSFNYAVIDLRLGTDCGLTLVEELCRSSPDCRAVVLTGFGSIATAIKAVKLGAINYLTKPAGIAAIESALHQDDLLRQPKTQTAKQPSLARHEREYIESVLSDCGGNISRAAKVLGLHRQSLQRKLRKFSPL